MLRRFFPAKKAQWLGPLLGAGATVVLIAALVIVSGIVDLSARKPHPEGWARLLHYVFRRSTAFHEGPEPPADLDSPVRIAAGAAYYGQACIHCHSGPGFGQNAVALSMHPRPQYLATDLEAADFTPRQLFRIVHDGVKYSAMPGWPAIGRDDEVWHLVAFLRALPAMSPERFRAMATPTPQPPAADADSRRFGPTPPGRPYRFINEHEPPAASFRYRWPNIGFGDSLAPAGDPLSTCASCHGADGTGGGAFPNLTIQDRGYLARALTGYADGTRESGFMRVIASQLSPRQIAALADHYAGLPRRPSEPAAVADPVGQRLALAGDPARGLGPCAGCHGVDRAAARAYPVLEGQSGWYIANKMRLYAGGGGEVGNPMVAIAKKLSEPEIAAVARYYAGRPPEARQSFAAAPQTVIPAKAGLSSR